MKKILFATTALVATAGIASADVAITGAAEMGIIGGSEIETQFHTDIDVTFTMTGESDNGLSFGASIDLDESDSDGTPPAGSPAFNNVEQGGETIFVSIGGATLTMGDTDGAFDKALTEVNYAGGSIADDETSHAGFSGNGGLDGFYDGQIARFDYNFSSVTASVSVEMDDAGETDPVWGIGVAYSGDLGGVTLGVGLGYQAVNDDNGGTAFGMAFTGDLSVVGISVDAGFSNGVTTGFNYSVWDIDGTEGTHGAIGIGYSMNALAVGVNYGHYSYDGDEVASGFGLAAAYDLGGGLTAQFGYGSSSFDSADDTDSFSLGLAMAF